MAPVDKKLNKGGNPQGEKQRINLGLTDLVASLNKTSVDGAKESAAITPTTETADVDSEISLESLADRKDWRALASAAQQKMSSFNGSDAVVATIWWGIANLETGEIPSAILSTPVSKASVEIERFAVSSAGSLVLPVLSSARLKRETAFLLFRLAKKNLSALTDKSVPEFLLRAVRLESSLSAEIVSLIEKECDRISKMSGRKKQRDERILALLDVKKACVAVVDIPKKEEQKILSKPDNQSFEYAKKQKGYLLLAAAVAAVCAIGVIAYDYLFFVGKDSAVGVAPLTIAQSDVRLYPLSSQRIKTVDNLEVLLAKVNSLAVPKVTQSSSRLGRHGSSLQVLETIAPTPFQINPGNRLEQIDTAGPVEGTVFYEKDRTQVESSSESVFGSEPPGVGGLVPQGADSKGISRPGVYRILTYTRVYAKASYFAQTIANLESGSRVQVVEKFGEWLKIRSKAGQVGFILSQDAEPVL